MKRPQIVSDTNRVGRDPSAYPLENFPMPQHFKDRPRSGQSREKRHNSRGSSGPQIARQGSEMVGFDEPTPHLDEAPFPRGRHADPPLNPLNVRNHLGDGSVAEQVGWRREITSHPDRSPGSGARSNREKWLARKSGVTLKPPAAKRDGARARCAGLFWATTFRSGR